MEREDNKIIGLVLIGITAVYLIFLAILGNYAKKENYKYDSIGKEWVEGSCAKAYKVERRFGIDKYVGEYENTKNLPVYEVNTGFCTKGYWKIIK